MARNTKAIEDKLRGVGLSGDVVRAAWPTWWSEEAETSPSALNDLKFSLSRKLGIAPSSLFDEGDATFVWHGEAKFKGLSAESDVEKQVLISFGTSIANLLLPCLAPQVEYTVEGSSPLALREAILNAGNSSIGISQVLRLTQTLRIPVVYLRVFPLTAKRMTAMTVRVGDKFAILLGKDAMHSAPVAFYITHELGHIANGHLSPGTVLIDAEIEEKNRDAEEQEADTFALKLLTGRSQINFSSNREPKNATELANAVHKASEQEHIDAGVLAMCYGHANQHWKLANAALKVLYGPGRPAWLAINRATVETLNLQTLTADNRDYLAKVIGVPLDD